MSHKKSTTLERENNPRTSLLEREGNPSTRENATLDDSLRKITFIINE